MKAELFDASNEDRDAYLPTGVSSLQHTKSLLYYDWRATTRTALHTGRMRGEGQNVADGRGELAGDLARSPDLQNNSGWFHVILLYYNDGALLRLKITEQPCIINLRLNKEAIEKFDRSNGIVWMIKQCKFGNWSSARRARGRGYGLD